MEGNIVGGSVYNRLGGDRITSRQIDELIGIARGIAADGSINQTEVEFLQKWLIANLAISDQPVVKVLYERVSEILADGVADAGERIELLDTLNRFSNRDFELGEVLKPTSLPVSEPLPTLEFAGRLYCFTGTFNFGQRKHCEQAIADRGGFTSGSHRKSNISSSVLMRRNLGNTPRLAARFFRRVSGASAEFRSRLYRKNI